MLAKMVRKHGEGAKEIKMQMLNKVNKKRLATSTNRYSYMRTRTGTSLKPRTSPIRTSSGRRLASTQTLEKEVTGLTRENMTGDFKARYNFLNKSAKEIIKKTLDQDLAYMHKHDNNELAGALRKARKELSQQ